VTPFLGKFPELLKWFKDFLGYKEGASASISTTLNTSNLNTNHHSLQLEGIYRLFSFVFDFFFNEPFNRLKVYSKFFFNEI
jgi:hypothetical protein